MDNFASSIAVPSAHEGPIFHSEDLRADAACLR